MTADAIVSQITGWLRKAILLLILVTLAVILLKAFGIVIPLRTLGHIELAYLAGAYWLTK